MDLLIAFYKLHYNFGMVVVLLVMLIFYLLSRRNMRAILVTLLLLAGYNIFIYTKTKQNPDWWTQSMERLEQTNFVDWLWGASTVEKNKKVSEERLNGN